MEANKVISKYDELIKSSMKARNKEALNVYKLIKAKMVEFVTQESKPVLDNTAEISLLKSMVKEIKGDIDVRVKANRLEQVPEFEAQLKIISDLLPKEASKEDIITVVDNYIKEHGEITQKDMGKVIGFVKKSFTNADGSLVASIVKSHIK